MGGDLVNKKTRALTDEQYVNIIRTLQSGFVRKGGGVVKPNNRVAAVLVLEANLGLRLFDVLNLRLESIVKDGNRYRLDIVEQKTQKKRTFTVPIEIYSYIQEYALENNINPKGRLFPISRRTVQYYLLLACEHLDYKGIGTHSFRKYFATDVYVNNHYNIELVRILLQHSSVVTTQRYIGIHSEQVESALQKHVRLI